MQSTLRHLDGLKYVGQQHARSRFLPWLILCASLPLSLLCAQTPGAASAGAEMARCLQVMSDPTLENAVTAAKQLQQLAGSQQGEAKAATEKLALQIRNLFYGEMVVKSAKQGRVNAEQKARDKEHSATKWLTPNVFGKVNQGAHDIDMREAGQLRQKAQQQLTTARDKLVEVVHATDAAIHEYDKAGLTDVAGSLQRAMKSVVARSLQSSEMEPSENGEFNNQMLAGLALLGLAAWASSGSGGGFSAPSAQTASDFDWNQRARRLEEQARQEESSQRERDAIAEQQRSWAAEAERAAAARAAAAEEAAARRAAEAAEAAARRAAGN